MRLAERSYSGKLHRPAPEVHIEPDGSFCAVVTPWGARSSAKKVIDVVSDFVLSAHHDKETTSPFQKLTTLSPMANNLRVAVMLANDILYREDNKNDYLSGVELFLCVKNETECAWVQIGHPQVFLSRPQRNLIPLGQRLDMSLDLSVAPEILAPLPHDLLGLATTSNFSVQSFRLQASDQLILLSRTTFPTGLLRVAPAQRTLKMLSDILAQDNQDLPFWLGLVDFFKRPDDPG